MNPIFFYGLFMDATLLEKKGLHPRRVGPAKLPDFRIQIGNRATLVPCAGSVAYGVVMALSAEEAKSLYSEPSVRDYQPEPVLTQLIERSETIDAMCYNLAPDSAGTGTNADYAMRLSKLVLDLGFPPAYSDEIARYTRHA